MECQGFSSFLDMTTWISATLYSCWSVHYSCGQRHNMVDFATSILVTENIVDGSITISEVTSSFLAPQYGSMVISYTETTEKKPVTCHLDKDDMSCQTTQLFPLFSEPPSRDQLIPPFFSGDGRECSTVTAHWQWWIDLHWGGGGHFLKGMPYWLDKSSGMNKH